MANHWPKQSACDLYYGNPRGLNGRANAKWENENLCMVLTPYAMTMGTIKINRIRIHKKCADSLYRVLCAVRDEADDKPEILHAWGASLFSGSYNFRQMRGIPSLSMHAYGCAIDFNAAENGLGDRTPQLTASNPLVRAFEKEGWIWGGRWKRIDAMHFQAAII